MKLLNTLITAFAFALPFSMTQAQPVKVDVPLGIQMGDKLEDIPALSGLKKLHQEDGYATYLIKGDMNLPSIFKFLTILHGKETGVCSVGLTSSDIAEGAEVKEGFRLAEKWLVSKYGAPDPKPKQENNDQRVDYNWANWGDSGQLQPPVKNIMLSHFIARSVNAGALDLVFEFDNSSQCELEVEDDKLKEFENL